MAIANLSTRIKAIQLKLNLSPSGIYDLVTLTTLCSSMEISIENNKSSDITYLAKSIQRFLNCSADGILGPISTTRIENYISTKLPTLPSGATLLVSKSSMEMLISFEVSSKAMYDKLYQKPIWPGGESGITVGIGFDIGFNTKSTVAEAFGQLVDSTTLEVLQSVAGITGQNAKNKLATLPNIKITFDIALQVFYTHTIPAFAQRTRKLYPGIEKLPPDAQGALLSLIYNRGTSISGDSRREMKNIIHWVAEKNLVEIANEIRNMKRIWKNKNLPGLLTRRDKEADMVANANFNILPENVIFV